MLVFIPESSKGTETKLAIAVATSAVVFIGVAVVFLLTTVIIALIVAAAFMHTSSTSNVDEHVNTLSTGGTSSVLPTATTLSDDMSLVDSWHPGDVPEDHGVSADDLANIVGSSVKVYGRISSDQDAVSGDVLERGGSGFAVGDGNHIVTNAHLIADVSEPLIELADGRRGLPGVVVAIDRVNDLAVLHVEGAGLDPLPLRSTVPNGTVGVVLAWTDETEPDLSPFRISQPIRVRTDIVDSSIEGDDIAGDTQRVERKSWLLAARIESGDSGAALVTFISGDAEIVGVVWGKHDTGNIGYASRISDLHKLLSTVDVSSKTVVRNRSS